MAIPISYNLRSLRQRPIFTLATALGIGLVVAILIGTLALANGFQVALRETGSPANAMILRVGADSEISSGISREAANVIRALPEVAIGASGRPLASAEMVVLVNLPRIGQEGSSNVTIRGIEPSAFELRDQVKVTAGHMFAAGSDELIVGERIAKRFANCKIGDRLRFNQRDFTVVGHFAAGGSAFESEIWGDAAVLMPTMDRESAFQVVAFRMRDPARLAQIEKMLEGDPRLGVQVQSERAFYAGQSQLLATVIRVAGIFLTLIMALGAIFGAMNTMFAAVGRRTREIATLMVLGFSPGAVMGSFVIESVVLALLGGVVGCLLALPINGITTSTTNWASFSEVAFAFRVTPSAMAIGLLFAAGMGFVGGLLPARRAATQSLAASLRAL
jgi:ABC-type lipoprotein release transport system permease subunit